MFLSELLPERRAVMEGDYEKRNPKIHMLDE